MKNAAIIAGIAFAVIVVDKMLNASARITGK